jgi:hypothetical protein
MGLDRLAAAGWTGLRAMSESGRVGENRASPTIINYLTDSSLACSLNKVM